MLSAYWWLERMTNLQMSVSPAKQPSAWLPIALSLIAFVVVLVYLAVIGTAREPDEGAAAHVWQLLMATQLPIVAYFAIKWVPKAPKQALMVLSLQAVAALTALAPVYFLGL
jgi:hypothetical protein